MFLVDKNHDWPLILITKTVSSCTAVLIYCVPACSPEQLPTSPTHSVSLQTSVHVSWVRLHLTTKLSPSFLIHASLGIRGSAQPVAARKKEKMTGIHSPGAVVDPELAHGIISFLVEMDLRKARNRNPFSDGGPKTQGSPGPEGLCGSAFGDC